MPLDSILGPQVTSLIAYATAVLTAFSLLYGFAKIAWTRMSAKPFPDNRVTRALDAIAELGTNVIGFVNKAKRGDGSPLIANPDVVARDATIAELRRALDQAAASLPVLADKAGAVAVSETREAPVTVYAPAIGSPLRAVTVSHRPPPPADGERGSVDVRAMLAVVVALAVALPLGVVVAGCPRMPPVSGCSPMAQTCIADSPHVCSASQRWHRAGALRCAQVGGSCAVVGGRAYCAAPVVDGGAR